MTAGRKGPAPSVTRSSLLTAAGEELRKRMHEYVPDLHDLNCAQCGTRRGNWQHPGELRAAVVVLNPRSPSDRLPNEGVSMQFEIPLPRPGTP